VLLSGVPLASRRRRHPRHRLREAVDRPQRDRSRLDQLPRQRIQIPRLCLLAEDHEALDHEREHPPRTSDILLAATRQPQALFLQEGERTAVIAAVRHLAKQRAGTESLKRVLAFQPACRMGMLQGAPPVTAKEIDQTELYL